MTVATALLQMALTLLAAASQPNVPAEMKTTAITVANMAIAIALQEQTQAPAAPPLTLTPPASPQQTAQPSSSTPAPSPTASCLPVFDIHPDKTTIAKYLDERTLDYSVSDVLLTYTIDPRCVTSPILTIERPFALIGEKKSTQTKLSGSLMYRPHYSRDFGTKQLPPLDQDYFAPATRDEQPIVFSLNGLATSTIIIRALDQD